MQRADQREMIAHTLAVVEQRVRDVADHQVDLHMTGLSDVVTDIEDVLEPLLDTIGNAADRLELPRAERSHRSSAMAALSLAWSDLEELAPRRLQRGYGFTEPLPGWSETRDALLDAIEHATARLKT
jgi:hypothetical protein